jgi:hypothetical protein
MKQRILFALVMGMITTCLVSMTLVLVSNGWTGSFLTSWLRSWLLSYIVAVPSIILIGPKVQSFLNAIQKADSMDESF